MSVLKLQGATHTMHLQGEQQEGVSPLSTALGYGTGRYRYRGQGVILGGIQPKRFLFTTFSREEARRFSVLIPVPFDFLSGIPRMQILHLLERSPSIVDALCEEKLSAINVWNQQKGPLFLPDLHFTLLSYTFIVRHLIIPAAP